METNKLQQLMDCTQEALAKANASDYFQKLFKTVSRQFIIYAHDNDVCTFSMDVGLKFLEDHYSMSQKIAEKKWCSMYLRCINAISEYQMTGAVDMYLTTTRKEYIFPAAFKESADSYLAYREKIRIIPKSIQISRLYLFRFFSFLETKEILSIGNVSVPIVLDFLKSLSSFEKPTVNAIMRAVRLYLKYCFENGFIQDNLFPKIPNPHYNRNSRLPSTYTAEEVRDVLSAIDMGNPCGIRDYAIILLLARLGLRSSGVANLRFSTSIGKMT